MPKILVIEDNADVRDNVVEILTLAGYDATSAGDGKAGVACAVADPPDLIFCDIMMPNLDGFGVLKILAARVETSGVPFVFLTAKSEQEDLRRGMNLGADDYVTKPFYKDELLRVLEIRLRKNAQRAPVGTVLGEWPGFRSAVTLQYAMSELMAGSSSRSYRRGEAVYREGERVRDVFTLGSGFAKHQRSTDFGKTLIIYVFRAGDLFGYPEMIADSTYAHDTIALTDIEVDSVPAQLVKERLSEDARVADLFLGALSSGLLDADERMVNLAYLSVRKRSAITLLRAADVFGDAPWPMSREELSQWAGTAKETFIRNLTDFRDSGYVRIDADRVTILDERQLRQVPG